MISVISLAFEAVVINLYICQKHLRGHKRLELANGRSPHKLSVLHAKRSETQIFPLPEIWDKMAVARAH